MSNRVTRVPTYRLKQCQGRRYAVVSLPDGLGGRHDVMLGQYGSRESRAEYARVLAEWEASGRRLPSTDAAQDITINELAAAFWPHVEQYYKRADGTPTSEVGEYKLSLRPLRQMYGFTVANKFGPLSLKAIRQRMIEQPVVTKVKTLDLESGKTNWTNKVVRIGLSRSTVNQRITNASSSASVSKRYPRLLVAGKEALDQALWSDAYSTPLLAEWVPYLRGALEEDGLVSGARRA